MLDSRGPVDMLINMLIWRITRVGHGSDALLISDRFFVFEAPANCHIVDIAIHTNLFARSMSQLEHQLSAIEILDWTKSTSSAHYKATIFTRFGERLVSLYNNS